MSSNMSNDMSITMPDSEPLVSESTKGFGVIHSYPFINDGLKFNPELGCTVAPRTKKIKQEPDSVREIKPVWKPVKLDEKPPYSYATLIAHAILSSDEKKMTLYEIYRWISEHYPCYSMKDHRWQNSIRHNLSLQKAFVKLERNSSSTTPSGKGCYWSILPGFEQQFIDNLFKRGMGRRSAQTASYKQCRKFMADNHSSKNAPLFTIFRMNPTYITKRKKPKLHHNKREDDCDSDCDSAVDLGCDSLPYPTEQIPYQPSLPISQPSLPYQQQQQQQDYFNLLDHSVYDILYMDDMFQPLDTQVSSWLDFQQTWQPLPPDIYPSYDAPIYENPENTFYI